MEEIRRIAEAVGLDAVQLHGSEHPGRVRQAAAFRATIKAFRVRPRFPLSRLKAFPEASAFLLDGYRPGVHGGTGTRFDWKLARRAARYGPVILAGGLRAENVAEAISRARPYAVDVSSGVESRPGKKDAAKVREFLRQVQQARRKRR
jgi:phosphoribosylanthranilate isomerase